jgi:hypothetical protein
MHVQSEVASEKIRNALIVVYMVGNAVTFTKVVSVEMAGPAELTGAILRALACSLVWPIYWLWRAVIG